MVDIKSQLTKTMASLLELSDSLDDLLTDEGTNEDTVWRFTTLGRHVTKLFLEIENELEILQLQDRRSAGGWVERPSQGGETATEIRRSYLK